MDVSDVLMMVFGPRASASRRWRMFMFDIFFFDLLLKGEEPPHTGGGRVFSFDATFGLMATRRRLGRRGGSFALRSAFVV